MKASIIFRRLISHTLVAIVMLFSFQSCGKKQLEPLKIDPAFAAYVISFTSGVVSNSTHIRVRLVQEIPNALPGKPLDFNPFSFSTNIKGEAHWVDKQTIEFVPEQHLPAGEIYTVDFALSKFLTVPSNLQTLQFRFQVMTQAINHEFEGISPCRLMDKQWQQVHNVFYTADYAEPADFEKAIDVSGDQSDYKLKWEHSKDGRTHTLTIDSVERKESPVKLQIEWDGSKIEADQSGKVDLEIPGLNDFKVMQVKTLTSPKTAIDVYFSDPLSKTQDITGLIALTPGAEESVIINGNIAHIVPGSTVAGDVAVNVYAGVKNVYGVALGRDFTTSERFVELKPQVALIGEGVIVPSTDGILFPFKAVSLNAVDVKIIRIFENNIVQFLQSNQLNGNQEVKRVGRVVYNEEVKLTSSDPIDYTQWNVFSLDLSKLINPEPGAIYRIEISFRKKHSLYPCTDSSSDDSFVEAKDPNESYNDPNEYWDYYEDEAYSNPDYNWNEKDDPCKASYYIDGSHRVARNVLASNFGIIAKAGTNSEYHVAITDLRTTDPIEDVEVEFRNLQNQLMTTVKTNSDGLCNVKLSDKPFVLIAKKETQRGYLRLDDASSLSLSMFDVKGEELKKGVKGFLYGERGVWRPGDMMYLTFVLEDKNNALPFNHPVVLELYNPSGQLAQRTVKTMHLNGFYTFQVKTQSDAPTGNWSAKVLVGGSTFARNLRIETVKPNRMKINLNFPSNILHNGVTETGKLQVNWLHGAPARNAKVTIDATIAPAKTEFTGLQGYVFDDPTKPFVPQDMTLFKGNLNAEGAATVQAKFNIAANSPGMVAVQMKTMAYDAGGDFSIDRAVFKYSPYKAYVGVKIPEGKGWNGALYSDEKNIIPIALVDENGRPLTGVVKVEIYNVYWRWWWDLSAEENLADYVSNQHTNLIKTDYVKTNNGRALYEMNLGSESWGRKLIKITDENGGHSTAAVFYTTYKGWWSNAGSENPGGAEMLMFQTNKKEYKVGEQVSVELPVSHKGRALISIETGSKVLRTFWFEPSAGKTKFTFDVTPEMSPNAYIHISYIQPHNHGKNDFPIRMYGVQAIKVEDPATHLTPVVSMKNVLKPMEKFTVNVKEAKGKPMTYTIAIVDDGLLDLTRFKTPNPWDIFYAHEALGVRTWDLYKYVSGAFTGKLAGLYAIGGDEFLNKKGKENNNRFKPVVLYQGPFSVGAGESKTHTFTMPNYVGSVRVMVVAGQNGAYGSAEKTVPVKQSLMVLSTLPRVVSPTEVIKVPVTVFAMDKGIKNVNVNISVDKNFEVLDGATRQITFNQIGDQLVEFKVKVKDHTAQGKIVVTATSGANRSTSETNLKIRMPNPPVTTSVASTIKPGETWSQAINAVGIAGTNFGTVEVSRFYSINLSKRLDYLIQYPHGCIEQITSAAFPQLFLHKVMDLSDARKQSIETNVKATLTKIKSYQLSNGGFTYWPGESSTACDWGTNYAGHFMLEAQALGYQLPVGLLEPWVNYQTTEANNWQSKTNNYGSDLIQAYRLYTLALAKRPVLSAMNRMRETAGISVSAKWRLAAAYAVAGKPDIASGILNGIGVLPKTTDMYADTYGSFERDQAMMLETQVLLKRQAKATPLVQDMAKLLASDEWLSTQSTAYMLLAISKYIGSASNGDALNYEITLDGKKSAIKTPKAICQTAINYQTGLSKQLIVRNNSKQNLYLRVTQVGIPVMKSTEAKQSNLGMTVNYFDMKGKAVNPIKMKQGTQFYAEVTVTHPGVRMKYDDLAINQIFPSGWEIMNSRMDEVKSAKLNTDVPRYQDIRDDRVYSYFNLDRGQKKVFRILLQAAYLGTFYMPSVQCEAMYDNTIYARTKGQWVEVVK
ncbi:MAG: MG2 domain-containing protein [Bacteroidales bacterium]|nr:MG2 domain-containing protein [Bacteroidales bacterium]